jgi:DNA-directed RNA polymerase specialized sigma24 family protein
MTKLEIEQAYKQYDKMLHKLSHQCAGRCGRPEEDVYGQACFLFMQATTTYRPGRGAFGTWLYTCIKNGLATWGIKMDVPRQLPADWRPGLVATNDPVTTLTPDRQLMFKDWLANLSEECREVALIILSGPAEVLEIGTGGCRKITARMIKTYLRGRGWTYPRIWQTMRELKQQVQNI